jgi:asparagine synthase (glutamine-hydrolysing)
MCGITGIVGLGGAPLPANSVLQAMCGTLRHRGPDDLSLHSKDGVALGNTRLAIIDVEGGRQPLFNESGSVRTVLNGEIYNFRELRHRLINAGHKFRTNCDTEVIVHAYEEYGLDFVNELNGIFALVLHDVERQKVILARDHMGVKPLYYALVNNEYLVWGSEIKSLLASGLVKPELSVDALGQFLSWEYVPGTQTLFEGIRQLAPAEAMVVDLQSSKISTRKYWDILTTVTHRSRSVDEWEDEIGAKITACVREQMVSDVPLGAFLSGGVDSSLVVASMGEASTFSIGFDDQSYNELDYATRIASHLGVRQTKKIIRSNVADLFDTLIFHLDDPIGDFSVFPTYLISRMAREKVTVALSGDGGDELFGGYETYIAQRYAHWYQYLPNFMTRGMLPALAGRKRPTSKKKGTTNKLKRFIEGAALPASLKHARWRIFASDELKEQLFTPNAAAELITPTGQHIDDLYTSAATLPELNRSLYVDTQSYLADNCLVKVDRMSMANSLEVRVPLLNKELVTMAFDVPPNLKIRGNETKWLLKRIASRQLPRECVYRPKEGFSIPMKHWLGTHFRPILEEYLSPSRLQGDGIFELPVIARLKEEHFAGSANHSHILWSLVVFHAWKERWIGTNAGF